MFRFLFIYSSQLRVLKKYRKIFVSFRLRITSCIAIRIRILFHHDVFHVLCKIRRIPRLIQNRLPHPYGRVIPIPTHHIANIRINPLRKFRSLIPELPSRSIDYYEKPQFITSIHKGGILRIMGISDHFQSGIPQFLCIPPMHAIRQCIAHNRKILVPVSTYQGSFIRFPVQPKTVLPLKLYAAHTDTTTITINHISLIIFYIHMQLIQIGRLRRPEMRSRQFYLTGTGNRLSFAYGKFTASFTHFPAIGIEQFINHLSIKRLFTVVSYLNIQQYIRAFFRHIIISNK